MYRYFQHRRENKQLWGVIRLIVGVPGIQLLLQEPPDATCRARCLFMVVTFEYPRRALLLLLSLLAL